MADNPTVAYLVITRLPLRKGVRCSYCRYVIREDTARYHVVGTLDSIMCGACSHYYDTVEVEPYAV